MKSIELDHCWVCSAVFIEHGGKAILNRHHVIPQAYGGVDGPTVTLCDTHHATLHQIAVALKAEKPYFQFIQNATPDEAKKLLYLGTVVYNAELATRNDPNKAAVVILQLNYKQKEMLRKLKSVYPKARSKASILQIALENLYNKNFIK